MFKYLGRRDSQSSSILRRVRDSGTTARSPRALRPCRIEIDSYIEGGLLHLQWTYGPHAHERTTIEALADGFFGIVGEITDGAAGGLSAAAPSDFPMSRPVP
jgi:non-ribosomal peptide synthase protein (TIGR01720 family)